MVSNDLHYILLLDLCSSVDSSLVCDTISSQILCSHSLYFSNVGVLGDSFLGLIHPSFALQMPIWYLIHSCNSRIVQVMTFVSLFSLAITCLNCHLTRSAICQLYVVVSQHLSTYRTELYSPHHGYFSSWIPFSDKKHHPDQTLMRP